MERDEQDWPQAVAASALSWWEEAGVDVLVDEAPRDWLKPAAKVAEPETAPAAPQEALPAQLDLFQAWLRDHAALPFASPSTPRVCPSGDPASGLMIVTDMPEAEDCAAGALLSGEAGTLFDRMLAAIGRDRASIYLASLSCFRPIDGRFAGPGAMQCAALARHHIGLAAPQALLLFGDNAGKALLGLSVIQARGRWHRVATHAGEIPAIVTFAPSTLLKRPADKKWAWADLQMLMRGPQ